MRVLLWAMLSTVLLAGCAERPADRAARRDVNRTPDTNLTDTPRVTTDRASPGQTSTGGAVRTDQGIEHRAGKPVIEEASPSDQAPPSRDNTGVNVRDSDPYLTETPTDQSEARRDIDTTAAIRRQIIDSEMSLNARNVKIMTGEDGKVTLRGVVNSDEEKQEIEKIAKEVAGEGNVESKLEVKRD